MKYLLYIAVIIHCYQPILKTSDNNTPLSKTSFTVTTIVPKDLQPIEPGKNPLAKPFLPHTHNIENNNKTEDEQIALRSFMQNQDQYPFFYSKKNRYSILPEKDLLLIHQRVIAGTAYQRELIPQLEQRISEKIATIRHISPELTELFLEEARKANIAVHENYFYDLLHRSDFIEAFFNFLVKKIAQATQQEEDFIKFLANTGSINALMFKKTTSKTLHEIKFLIPEFIHQNRYDHTTNT